MTAPFELRLIDDAFLREQRSKADHGNRATPAMRETVLARLEEAASKLERVPGKVVAAEAQRAGVSERTVWRWWKAHTTDEVEQAPAGDGLPRYLRRTQRQGNALALSEEEVVFFASQTTTLAAIEAIQSDPGHRLHGYSRSALYQAYADLPLSVRQGARKGHKAQRAQEMTAPLRHGTRVNDGWTIDEYDPKIRCISDLGTLIEPKILVVRDAASTLILAASMLPKAATGADAAQVIGAAIVGWHRDGTDVTGPARLLHCDQGVFIASDVVTKLAYVGIGVDPQESHTPQANGAHEVMHQILARTFTGGPGSRRGWAGRDGTILDNGEISFNDARQMTAHAVEEYNDHAITKGPRKGQSPWQAYQELVQAGQVHRYEVSDEQVGELAVVVAENSVDLTRGVWLDGDYFTSADLATAALKGMRVTLRQLLDPNVAYAYDKHGTFLAQVTRRQELSDDEVDLMHRQRAQRAHFVEDSIARPKARSARAAAASSARGNPTHRPGPPQPAQAGSGPGDAGSIGDLIDDVIESFHRACEEDVDDAS